MRNILFILLLPLFSFSQELSIKGAVLDELNEPVAGANIVIKNTTKGVVSDFEGNFSITVSKNDILMFSFLGYKSQEIEIVKNNVLTIKLLPENNQIKEIVVVATASKVKSGLEKTTYEVKSNTAAIGGTGLDALRNLPSVSIDAQNTISYRGNQGFVVQLNGKTMQMDAATLLSQISANDIEKIDIVSIPSSKYDNEGKTGIINVITKNSSKNFSSLQVNLKGGLPTIEDYGNAKTAQRHGADIVYAYQKNKWDFSVGANYNRNDMAGLRDGHVYTLNGTIQRNLVSLGERSIKNINYSGKFSVGYAIDSTQSINLGTYFGKQIKERTADLVYHNYSIDVTNPSNQFNEFQYFNQNSQERRGDFAIVGLDYSKRFKNKSSFSTSFLYEHTLLGGPTTNNNLGFPDNSIIYQNEYNTNDNPLDGFRFQTDYKFKPFDFGTIEVGYQYKNLTHKGNFFYQRRNNTTGIYDLIPEFSSEVNLFRDSHSLYTQLSKISEKWDYNIGVRAETLNRDFELKDKANIVNESLNYKYDKLFPSASVMYKQENGNKVKVGYSKRVEHTTTFKMNPFPEREHSETLEQGDKNLLPEFIDLAELSYNYKIKKARLFSTLYFRNVDNLINRVNTVYNDSILNRIYSNVGNAKTFGFESGIDYKTSKFSIFASANVFNTAIKGSFNNGRINTDAWMFSSNINANYKFTETFETQFNFNYLSQRITAQGEDSEFYLPSLILKKSFLNKSLVATLQWQNIDMGLLKTNEQRITTFKPNVFYTTTNYIQEVDMIVFNLSYIFNSNKKSKFVDSEFGKQEF